MNLELLLSKLKIAIGTDNPKMVQPKDLFIKKAGVTNNSQNKDTTKAFFIITFVIQKFGTLDTNRQKTFRLQPSIIRMQQVDLYLG